MENSIRTKKNNKKILIVASTNKYGGARTYLKNIISYYQKNNWEISIATETKHEINELLHELNIINVKIYKLPDKYKIFKSLLTFRINFLFFFQYKNVNKIAKKIKPSLVFVTPTAPTAYLSLILLPYKKIFAVHSYPQADSPYIFKIMFKHKNVVNSVFITVSKYSQKMIKKHWGIRSRVIYNPAEIDRLKSIRKKEAKEPKYILTSGHLVWYKDPYTWIKTVEEVFKHLPEFPYKFVWLGDGKLKNKIQNIIKNRNLEGKCIIKSPTNSIEEVFKYTYIYFQPSLMESQGISVTNALYLGIPSVVSKIGGLPEVIEDKKSGYIIESSDYKNMAKKIIYLYQNRNIYQELSKKSIIQSEKFYKSKWIKQMDIINSQN